MSNIQIRDCVKLQSFLHVMALHPEAIAKGFSAKQLSCLASSIPPNDLPRLAKVIEKIPIPNAESKRIVSREKTEAIKNTVTNRSDCKSAAHSMDDIFIQKEKVLKPLGKGVVADMVKHINDYVAVAGVDKINKSLGFESLQLSKIGTSSLNGKDIKPIGSGAFKTVYGAKPQKIALAYFKSSEITEKTTPLERKGIQKTNELIAREVDNFEKIFADPLPNIVPGRVITIQSKQTKEIASNQISGILVTKLASEGTGANYLATTTNQEKKQFFIDAFNGVMGLHSKNLGHFDGHLENYLVNIEDQSKEVNHKGEKKVDVWLCDFGATVGISSGKGLVDKPKLLCVNTTMLPPVLYGPVNQLLGAQAAVDEYRSKFLPYLDSVISNSPDGQQTKSENLPENVSKMIMKFENDQELFKKLQTVIASGKFEQIENALPEYTQLFDQVSKWEGASSLYFTRHVDVYHSALNMLSVCSKNNSEFEFDNALYGKKPESYEDLATQNLIKNTNKIVRGITMRTPPANASSDERENFMNQILEAKEDLKALKSKNQQSGSDSEQIEISDSEGKAWAAQKNLNKLIAGVFPSDSDADTHKEIRELITQMTQFNIEDQPSDAEIFASLKKLPAESFGEI